MIPFRFAVCVFVAVFSVPNSFIPGYSQTASIKPPSILVTDNSWEVSTLPVKFGEYPLSAEQIPALNVPLHGGSSKAVSAEHNVHAKIIPGAVPIWRNRTTTSEGEAYHFRKALPFGAAPIQKITLEVNCDDIARVYINQRLASEVGRDGKMKDGYDDWYTFRSVSGFTYNRVYTYDVTDYFFANVTNTIFVEAVSLAFDGSHAYFSAKLVIELGPEPSRPAPTPPKRQLAAAPPVKAPAKKTAAADALPGTEKLVFEAGSDPGIEKLRPGTILELGQVYFNVNEYQLDSTSYRTLSALAAYMQRHPSLKIEIGGHTNLLPNDDFAATLSTNRARAVARYLSDNGIAAERVKHKGYGKSQPRVWARTKEANRVNQRVEVKVLEQ